jgi:alpha-L-fucosidase
MVSVSADRQALGKKVAFFHSYFPRCVNFSPVILNTEKKIEGSYNQRRSVKQAESRTELDQARKCSGKSGQCKSSFTRVVMKLAEHAFRFHQERQQFFLM